MVDLALMFDFDGTLYVGDLPILAYARHCAEQLDDRAATDLIDGVRFFLEGRSTGNRPIDLPDAEDGYQAVEALAKAQGLTCAQIRHAYRLGRADLAASAFALEAPEGLVELLNELRSPHHRQGLHVMVVTDVGDAGVAEVLTAVGLTELVDDVITDAGKSAGMPAIITRTLRLIDAVGAPDRLMVVGDRWTHDLADAHRSGAVTAMVDRFRRGDGQPELRAPDLAGLIPGIRRWAQTHRAPEHLAHQDTAEEDTAQEDTAQERRARATGGLR